MRRYLPLLALGAATLCGPAMAQLGLRQLSLPPLIDPRLPLNDTLKTARETVGETVDRLMTARIERIDRLVRRFPDLVELDASGDPARRGELLLVDPAHSDLQAAEDAGFVAASTERMDSLGLTVVRLSLPAGVSLAQAEVLLHKVAPTAEIAADTLHFQSGSALPIRGPWRRHRRAQQGRQEGPRSRDILCGPLGSLAAQGQGAFAVEKGTPILDASGDKIGSVRSVVADARGHVQQLLVKVDGERALLPGGVFQVSGEALISSMGEGQIKQIANQQEDAR